MFGSPSSPDYNRDGMNPFGKTSTKRRTGKIFGGNDFFILKTLFYPISVHFGYEKEDKKTFKDNLKKIRPLLNEPFDFEKKMSKKQNLKLVDFKKSGQFKYFHSQLIERWKVLNQLKNHPLLISTLLIEN